MRNQRKMDGLEENVVEHLGMSTKDLLSMFMTDVFFYSHFPENFVTVSFISFGFFFRSNNSFSVQPLTKEKAKNRTFTNELESRLQSAINGNNKSGTLRKRPANDETRE